MTCCWWALWQGSTETNSAAQCDVVTGHVYRIFLFRKLMQWDASNCIRTRLGLTQLKVWAKAHVMRCWASRRARGTRYAGSALVIGWRQPCAAARPESWQANCGDKAPRATVLYSSVRLFARCSPGKWHVIDGFVLVLAARTLHFPPLSVKSSSWVFSCATFIFSVNSVEIDVNNCLLVGSRQSGYIQNTRVVCFQVKCTAQKDSAAPFYLWISLLSSNDLRWVCCCVATCHAV